MAYSSQGSRTDQLDFIVEMLQIDIATGNLSRY